jgi:hypothetical protein
MLAAAIYAPQEHRKEEDAAMKTDVSTYGPWQIVIETVPAGREWGARVKGIKAGYERQSTPD